MYNIQYYNAVSSVINKLVHLYSFAVLTSFLFPVLHIVFSVINQSVTSLEMLYHWTLHIHIVQNKICCVWKVGTLL